MSYTERARALRPFIIKAAASLSDADALQAKELYARWAPDMVVKPGNRLVHAVDGVDKLFRVNEGQSHTTQEGWEPDKTPALFTVINETNAGTKEDPILAARGMEYTSFGKIAEQQLLSLEDRCTYLSVEQYVIMTNHIYVVFAL